MSDIKINFVIAKDYGIPIFNLYHENAYKELIKFIQPFTLF